MDPRSSNSPDPPDGGHHPVSDKDSQESTTLQNAMQPLPNTQPETQDQRISPEDCTFATPQLISRPVSARVDDFSDGFAFGKPKEIKSGQYSKRGDNTKPIDPIVQTSVLGNDAPQVPTDDHRDHVAATQGRAAAKTHPAPSTHAASPHENSFPNHRQLPPSAETTDFSGLLPQDTGHQQGYQSLQAGQNACFSAESPRGEIRLPQSYESPQVHQRMTVPMQPDTLQARKPAQIFGGHHSMKMPIPQGSHPASVTEGHRLMPSQLPQTLQDTPAHPALETRPRKKAPFDHYQPTYRSPKPQQPVPIPVTSLNNTVGPQPEHHSEAGVNTAMRQNQQYCQVSPPSAQAPQQQYHAEAGQHITVHQNHQARQASSPSAQAPQQKSRLSLRNDTSVSTAQPARRIPPKSPVVAVMSRPMKEGRLQTSRKNTPIERPASNRSLTRSSIVRSNSKAKRCKSPKAPSSVRTSSSNATSRCGSERTPTVRGRSDSIQQDMLKRQVAAKFTTAAAHISTSLNDSLGPLMDEVDQHLATICKLKQKLKQQKGKMSTYKEEVEDKNAEVQQLEGERGQLLAEVQAKDEELQKTSGKISKLEDKCRQYKEYLNSAIAEQQELYKATKAKCDGAVAQMKAEEGKRKGIQERELKRAETIREELSQLVKSTVSEYKHKEREFNNTIEALNQKVRERDADIKREREQAQVLLQQNASINSIQDTLKTFGTQMAEMASKVDSVVAVQHQQDDQALKETSIKLDQIMQSLSGLTERTLPSADIKREMQEMNAQTVSSIVEKLEPILAAQIETKTGLESLTVEIARSVDDLYEQLEDRQSVIEEYCDQRLARREERISALQNQVDEFQTELAHQNELFFNSEQTLRAREASLDELELKIEELMAQDQDQDAMRSEQLEELRKECNRLKDTSNAQESLVTELQTKLSESIAKLRMEEQSHQEHAEDLRKQLEHQVAEAKATQEQAVEAAQRQTMLRMNAIKASLEEQLSQVLDERTAQRLELEAAKQKITLIESKGFEMSEKATGLEKELASCRAEASKVREQASVKDAEQQTAKEQQQQVIDELQFQLDRTNTKFQKLAENAVAYDRAAQTVVIGMKQWTQNYAAVHAIAKDLRKSGMNSGIYDGFDIRFKPLVEMQLLLTAVSRYCQSQKEAAQLLSGRATVQTASDMFPTAEAAAGNVLTRVPRVVIRSPAGFASSPEPLSVQIEQERRRGGELPKSILKPTAYTQSRNEEAADELANNDELLNNTWMNRGPYNRLVEGNSGGPSMMTVPGGPRKRAQTFGQDSQQKRVKESTSGSTSACFSPPEQDIRSGNGSVPRAPRKAGSSRSLAGSRPSPEGQGSPIRSSQSSQDEPRNGRVLFKSKGHTSKGSQPDAVSVFFERRRDTRAAEATETPQVSQQSQLASQNTDDGYHSQQRSQSNEESQESLSHSQDVGGRELSPPQVRSSRFSFR